MASEQVPFTLTLQPQGSNTELHTCPNVHQTVSKPHQMNLVSLVMVVDVLLYILNEVIGLSPGGRRGVGYEMDIETLPHTAVQ